MISRALLTLQFLVTMAACAGGGPDPDAGIVWPRFPLDPANRYGRTLALVYSTGPLGPNSTLADLGYPGRNMFRFHDEHPMIHVILRSCPANRYSGDRSVLESPGASGSWRALSEDPRFDWIEIANQGYTHSPPDDVNLDHHEFSTSQEGCNLDHAALDDPAYVDERMDKIRTTYQELGIPVSLIQFPGLAGSEEALRAARRSRFSAVLGRPPDPYLEQWAPAGEATMLLLPITWIRQGQDLAEALSSGRIEAGGIPDSPEYLDGIERLARIVDDAAEVGGILILSDTWRETFERIAGTYPRYLILDAVLRRTETRYVGRIWYPRGRDLSLWLHARHEARVRTRTGYDQVEARIELPESWAAAAGPDGLEGASVILRIPDSWRGLRSVRIDDGSGWRDLDTSLYWMRRDGVAVVFTLKGSTALQALRD